MAIYYTQILSKNSKKILTASFSLAGVPLKPEKTLLFELKTAVSELPNIQKVYSLNTSNKNLKFYFIISDKLLVSVIADTRTTDRIIQKYFDEVLNEYNKKYNNEDTHYDFDDSLKVIMDGFNKKYNILIGVEELENTHSTLVENLDSLIKRKENINNLDLLAQRVNMETREISKKVSNMKFNTKLDQYKVYGVLLMIIILFVYFFFIR